MLTLNLVSKLYLSKDYILNKNIINSLDIKNFINAWYISISQYLQLESFQCIYYITCIDQNTIQIKMHI